MEPQIFEDKAANTFEGYPISYSNDIYSDVYVDQFLNICEDGIEKSLHEENRYPIIMDLQPELQPQNLVKPKSSREKSGFHNFQKHLVTTLRNNIHLDQSIFTEETKDIEKKLWKCFLECPHPTRTLIFLITGEIDTEILRHNQKFQKLYGVYNIFKTHQFDVVTEAQQNLRKQILTQLQMLDIQSLIMKRRMKKKQEFKVYFMTFYEELQAGRLSRRVSKQVKLMKQQEQEKQKINKGLEMLSLDRS